MSDDWLADPLISGRHEVMRAVAWCQHRAEGSVESPVEVLRSPSLKPPIFVAGSADAVSHVQVARWHALQGIRPKVRAPSEWAMSNGRLLLFHCWRTTYMESCWSESEGLIDRHDVPPWDTWIGTHEGGRARRPETSLISWIPARYVALASAAVDSSPEAALEWADEVPAPTQMAIRTQLAIDTLPTGGH